MTPRSLGLFVKKLQPKVGLAGYDILFTYFVVEAKSKNGKCKKNALKLNAIFIVLDENFFKYFYIFLKFSLF